MGVFSNLEKLKKNKAFKILIGGTALSAGAAGTALAAHGGPEAPAEERERGDGQSKLDLEGRTLLVPNDDVLGDDLDSENATPDSPVSAESPASADSPASPASADTPATPESPASPESPATPESPASPASPESPASPASPESPASPATPESPASPATPDSPDTDDDED